MDGDNTASIPNFTIKSSLFSDISDDELLSATEKILVETTSLNTSKHYTTPISDTQRDIITKSRFAETTDSKSKWAVNLFNGWLDNRKSIQDNRPDLKLVSGDLLSMETGMLNYCLGAFVFEVMKSNGDNYRGNTLYEIVSSIQHYLRQNGRFVSLFDDAIFEGMRNNLDKKMKDLAKKGIGINRRQACVISTADEDNMWQDGILGSDTPRQLRDTVLYLIGLNFALRGGREHYDLRIGDNSQLQIGVDKETGYKYIQYTEDVSKCCQGGIDHRKLKRKQTKAYQNHSDPCRCLVTVYQKYISLRPKSANCNSLYLRVLTKPTSDVWYADARMGMNTLSKIVKTLCSSAGMDGYYTNHSLRSTAATRMYGANLSEQVICEKTGHRSDAVRDYKHTSTMQDIDASYAIQGVKRKPYIMDENKTDPNRSLVKITKGDISVHITL